MNKLILLLITLAIFSLQDMKAQTVKSNELNFAVVTDKTVTINIEDETDAIKVVFSQLTSSKIKKNKFNSQWGPDLFWQLSHVKDKQYMLIINDTEMTGTLGKLKSHLKNILDKSVKYE